MFPLHLVFIIFVICVTKTKGEESLEAVSSAYIKGSLTCKNLPYHEGNVTISVNSVPLGATRPKEDGSFEFGVVSESAGPLHIDVWHNCETRPDCEEPYVFWKIPDDYVCPGKECVHPGKRTYQIGVVELRPPLKSNPDKYCAEVRYHS